jgi:hypothetical protein
MSDGNTEVPLAVGFSVNSGTTTTDFLWPDPEVAVGTSDVRFVPTAERP